MKLVHVLTVGAMFGQGKANLELFKEELKTITNGVEGGYFDEKCAELCYKTKSCRFAKHKQGSYCKNWDHKKRVGVCFGLYFKKHHDGKDSGDDNYSDYEDGHDDRDHGFGKDKLCYRPNDKHCKAGRPVFCYRNKHHDGHDDKDKKDGDSGKDYAQAE